MDFKRSCLIIHYFTVNRIFLVKSYRIVILFSRVCPYIYRGDLASGRSWVCKSVSDFTIRTLTPRIWLREPTVALLYVVFLLIIQNVRRKIVDYHHILLSLLLVIRLVVVFSLPPSISLPFSPYLLICILVVHLAWSYPLSLLLSPHLLPYR